MADDGDDFVFDEDGIYRERALDTDQDFLDEDGIWRDDDEDDDLDTKDHLDRYTFRTDSGFGTAEPRSSISTLNKVPLAAYNNGHNGRSIDRNYDEDFGDQPNGSFMGGEKSLNISDLEASASVGGDYDFEHVSLDSNAEVDLPELLNDGLSSGSSNQTADVGDLNDFDDFNGSHNSIGLFDGSLNLGGQRRSSLRGKPQYQVNNSLDRIKSTQTHSFDDNFHYLENNHHYRSPHHTPTDNLSRPHRYSREPPGQPPGLSNNQSIAEYLLSGGGGNNRYRRPSGLSELELGDEVGQLFGPVGDREFAQNTPEVLSYPQRQSLMEFEQLEAALDGDGHTEKSGRDNMDLIGAYLQGLKDQEEEEEEEEDPKEGEGMDHDDSYDRMRKESRNRRLQQGRIHHHGSLDRIGSVEGTHGTGERMLDRAGSVELSRISYGLMDRHRHGHGPIEQHGSDHASLQSHGSLNSTRSMESRASMDRNGSVESHGSMKSHSLKRPGSLDQQNTAEMGEDSENQDESVEFLMSQVSSVEQPGKISQSNGLDNETPQQMQRRSPHGHSPLTKDDCQQDLFETANSAIIFNYSADFMENQEFPFDSMSFSPREMTGGTNKPVSRDATISEANSSHPSKIPMLRNRSPSMTRSENTSLTRSQPPTPERTSRVRVRPSDGRSLPKIPQRGKSERDSICSMVKDSREGSSHRETSEEFEDDSIYNRTRYSEEEESELEKAASFLLGQTDPVNIPVITPVVTHEPIQRKKSVSASNSQPGSRPGSAKKPQQMSTTSSMSVQQRPSSATGVRTVVSKKDLLMKGSATNLIAAGMLGSQPLRTIGREVEEADRALQDAQQRQLNEETLKQLQQDYNTLLQKHAQAENTIDSLRIGATIPISVELTATGGSTEGTISGTTGGDGSRVTGAPPIGTPGNRPLLSSGGSMSHNISGTRPSKPAHGSRPGSAHSRKSSSGQMGHGHAVHAEQLDQLAASLSGEGDKLSLLAKAKGVEEKARAFSILLNENCLSTADQMQALQNVCDAHEGLQQDYRDARSHHDYMVRMGELPHATPAFDSDKAIEGELYKLGKTMDDLEEQVQESVKARSSARVPFKADHSIDVNGMNTTPKVTEMGSDLAPDRPPSVGSFAGGPEDIDKQLHRLTKDYNQLMDRYRRLKGLKKTPERDMQIDKLLKNLRKIYEETPAYRRPALPPELENHYNPVKDHFMSSGSEGPRRGSLTMYSSKGQETDSLPGLNASDLSIGRHSKSRLPNRKNTGSSGYTSSATDSTTRQKRQRLPPRAPPVPASYDSLDSVISSPSRKSESSGGRRGAIGRYSASPSGKRRNEREDKDSGYVGSEASRRVANQGQDKDRLHSAAGIHRNTRSLAKSSHESIDVTQSTSDLSTVEHVRPYRPATAVHANRNKSATTATGNGDGLVAVSGSNKSQMRSKRAVSDPSLTRWGTRGRANDVLQTGDATDSDVSSHESQTTNRSRPSVKSEQIQSLANQITMLRDDLRTHDNQPVTSQPQMTSQPVPILQSQLQPTSQQLAYMYYPYQDGTQLPAGVPIDKDNVQPLVYVPQTVAGPALAPSIPMVQAEMYTEQYGPQPAMGYQEFREPRPVDHWQGVDRRNDYSAGHSDSDDNERYFEKGNRISKERDFKRTQRLRDYYIPSRHQRVRSPVMAHSQGRNRPVDDIGEHYPAEHRYQTPVYGMGKPAGPPIGARPPTYQQVRNSVCGMCGGSGQHSHGDYMYIPSTVPAQPVQAEVQPTATPGYVLVPTPANISQPQVQPVQTTAYVPVQMVEKPVKPKVRYYVREYGGDAEMDFKPIRRSCSHGNVSRIGKKTKHIIVEEAVSDSEGYSEDLNDSLDSALRTASQIKVISHRMKKTLKTELDQSLRSSRRAMAY